MNVIQNYEKKRKNKFKKYVVAKYLIANKEWYV